VKELIMETVYFDLDLQHGSSTSGMNRQDMLSCCETGDFVHFLPLSAGDRLIAITCCGEEIGALPLSANEALMPFLEEGKSYECFIDCLTGEYGSFHCKLRCHLKNEVA
jgi:hypothetical protein